MPKLSKRILSEVSRDTYKATGARPFFMDLGGHTDPEVDPLGASSKIRRLRAYALHESVNTGEPYFFEVLPGVMSWLVALEDRRIIHGAMIGGEVFPEEAAPDDEECLRSLTGLGLTVKAARDYAAARPSLSSARIRESAEYLRRTFYQISGWKPLQMEENRLRVMQQQQIASAIEDQKRRGGAATYPFEKERILLSHIRAGDQAGARRVLNEMLGAMYMTAPKLVVLRARAIELMGYLTRAAVEDSPIMESLIERNHQWMRRLISARDFEQLARVLTDALNDFIEGIYLHGFNRSNTHVSKALDFITRHYAKPLTLTSLSKEVGLSSFRLAHVVKAHTGKTVLQIINHARIQNAQHLLEHSEKSCTEIAYEVGFNDQSYFIKHFKRLTGITPARYRRTRMVRSKE
ncbi:MAG: helix-turn-helix domain-containing protein [bacterium]